jgi:hypothetical protein
LRHAPSHGIPADMGKDTGNGAIQRRGRENFLQRL